MLDKLRAVAEAARPSLLHTSLSSSLHPDVIKHYQAFDPETCLALLDRVEYLEKCDQLAASMFAKLQERAEAWRAAANRLWHILNPATRRAGTSARELYEAACALETGEGRE